MACVFNLVLGFGLYSATYLTPVFLGRVRDFNSFDTGTVVFVVGISQLLGVVITTKLSQRVDLRVLITPGLAAFAGSLWWMSYVTVEWGFWELLGPQLLRGLAIMLCIVPSVSLALSSFEGAELRYASGLFNLMRNLGGAIGIALVNVWLYDETRRTAARFGEALGQQGRSAPAVIDQITARASALTPDPMAAAALAKAEFARFVGRQALTIGFDEVFRTMAWLFLGALILVPFCRPAKPGAAAPAVEAH
jgi:DHA2 family multidrug resistance protein